MRGERVEVDDDDHVVLRVRDQVVALRLEEAHVLEPLQRVDNLHFLETESDALIAYVKDDVIVVVNLDPRAAHEGLCIVPVALRLPPAFVVRDLLSGEVYPWRIGRNYVRLDAGQSHVLKVTRHE